MTASTDTGSSVVRDYLRTFGLESLADWAWAQHLAGASDQEIMLEIRQRPEYKARFPAMEQLAKEGRAIDEISYINYESTVRSLLHQYGIVQGMYDTPEQIAKLLLSDVSAAEVNDRLQTAAALTFEVPAEVRNRFMTEYGGTPGGLASYFLDPDRAGPLLNQQYRAAQVMGAADQQRVQVGRDLAENLALSGVTYEQARTGFGQVAQTAALGAGYGETIGTDERIKAAFGDAGAAAVQRRVTRSRQSQFMGGGSAAETQAGVSGLGASSSR